MNAQDRVRALLDRDPASQHLGVELLLAQRDLAELRMVVQDFMVNGHGTCHGGFLFALADSAFAFACTDRGKVMVQSAQVEYLAPTRAGDTLVAQAILRHTQGRRALGSVTVHRGEELVLDLRASGRFVEAD